MLQASRDHLAEVDESYGEHLRAALTIAVLLAKAALACALHAVIPGLFTRTASRCVARVVSDLDRRHAIPAKSAPAPVFAQREWS